MLVGVALVPATTGVNVNCVNVASQLVDTCTSVLFAHTHTYFAIANACVRNRWLQTIVLIRRNTFTKCANCCVARSALKIRSQQNKSVS